MSDILTWHERAMAHPDHQSGMISEDMIRARMAEEISDLRAEVERLTRQRDEARAEVEIRPAVYVLLSDDGGIEDRDRQSDEICGCYLSREAAERAGNELNVRWRIEEYGLEAKT